MTDMPLDEAIEKARDAGNESGMNAASWVFDGNTADETYATVEKWIDDGDPLLDTIEPPSWGDRSLRDLCDEIGIDYDLTETPDMDKISDAYTGAVHAAFWAEVEGIARQHERSSK